MGEDCTGIVTLDATGGLIVGSEMIVVASTDVGRGTVGKGVGVGIGGTWVELAFKTVKLFNAYAY